MGRFCKIIVYLSMRIYKDKVYIYRTEVTCKDCGVKFTKENWTIKNWKGRCHPCSRIIVGKSTLGLKRNEQHKLRTGLASKGRVHTEETKRIISERHSGEKNNNWISDRQEVDKRRQARKELYSLIGSTLRRSGIIKCKKSIELVGYTSTDLYNHITSKFKEGMSWENRTLWHIDHKKAVSAFFKEGVYDLKVINALDNLQPLWAKENLLKGCK